MISGKPLLGQCRQHHTLMSRPSVPAFLFVSKTAHAHHLGPRLGVTPTCSSEDSMVQVSAKAQRDGQLTMGLSLQLLQGKCLHSACQSALHYPIDMAQGTFWEPRHVAIQSSCHEPSWCVS